MARATRHFTNDVPFIYLITPPPDADGIGGAALRVGLHVPPVPPTLSPSRWHTDRLREHCVGFKVVREVGICVDWSEALSIAVTFSSFSCRFLPKKGECNPTVMR